MQMHDFQKVYLKNCYFFIELFFSAKERSCSIIEMFHFQNTMFSALSLEAVSFQTWTKYDN